MDKRKLFNRQALLVAIIALVNYGAIKFHWYYSLWWFDMPMHFLGGMWVAMLLAWYLSDDRFSTDSVGRVILGAFIVGLSWEVFELLLNEQFVQNAYDLPDTLSDIFFDLSGAFTAVFYVALRIMNIPESGLKFYNAEKS
ncbi:MAG: hypothetical protein KBC12_02145 [Candidatus Pacebacteria bacterium]|nr:hypothetical protein [Candidatus Paceibacterota bacterium]MBP9851223.1 hypothetical protein [Candidatus Paceibacterota bacterium]